MRTIILFLCDLVYLNNLQYWQFKSKYQDTYNYYCFALMTERLPVTAWKPVLIVWTEHLEWHVIHCKKNNRVSLFRMVSGDRQVWQVTYSLIYLLNTFSICFCWKRPFIINWLLPSTAPTVPNSAERNARRCFGWRCNLKIHIVIMDVSIERKNMTMSCISLGILHQKVSVTTTLLSRISKYCYLDGIFFIYM